MAKGLLWLLPLGFPSRIRSSSLCLCTDTSSVPRSTFPSTERGAERTEQPNISRCSVQFDTMSVMRACSIRLFGSAYQPGVLLGFGARLRFFLQEFTNFVCVLEKCILRHLFPPWEWCPARFVRVLDTLIGTSARRFARFGCAQDSYLYRPIRFDCSFDYVGYPSLYLVRYSTSKSCRACGTLWACQTANPVL